MLPFLALNPSRPPRNKQKKLKNFSKSYAKENLQDQQQQKSSSSTSGQQGGHPSSSSSTLPVTGGIGAANKQSVRITQFTDPHDILITDLDELQTMDKFMTKKIREMEEGKKKSKESMVDTVFKSALKDFKANLISTYSVGNYQDGSHFRLTYKDLIDHFEQVKTELE